MNPSGSRFSQPAAGEVVVRIEPHAKGEVFTYERVREGGRKELFSMILYLDGKPRDSQYDGRPAAQVSRQLDNRTVEIIWNCSDRRVVRLVRRLAPNAQELFLDWSESLPNASPVESHLLLEKQGPSR